MCTSICSLLCTQTCFVWFLRKWGYNNKKYRSFTVEIQFKVHIFLVSLLNFICKVRSFDLEDLIFSVKLVFLMLVFFTPPFSCWENGGKDWFFFLCLWVCAYLHKYQCLQFLLSTFGKQPNRAKMETASVFFTCWI